MCFLWTAPLKGGRGATGAKKPKVKSLFFILLSPSLAVSPSIIVNQRLLSFSLDVAARAKVEKANHDSESGEGAKVRDGETMKVRVMEGETERMKEGETERMKEGEAERVKVKEVEAMKVKEGEVERSSGHRVTFNDQNEVASQDRDGTFKVRLAATDTPWGVAKSKQGRGQFCFLSDSTGVYPAYASSIKASIKAFFLHIFSSIFSTFCSSSGSDDRNGCSNDYCGTWQTFGQLFCPF